MEKRFHLSIIIPAYNEEKRIGKILNAIEKYVKDKDFSIETILVADGCTDKTADVGRSYCGKIPNLRVLEDSQNKGKGGAIKDGILSANGEYVLFADADNSTPIEQADTLLKYADKYDIVIASRYSNGGKLAKPQGLVRRLGSRGINIAIQLLAVFGIKDTQCGFKLFRNEVAKVIFSKITIFGWSFDIEVLAIAKKLKYSIYEAGVVWYDSPNSRLHPFADGIRMIGDAWKIRKNIILGIYK